MKVNHKTAPYDAPEIGFAVPTIETTNRQLREKRKDTIAAIAGLNERAPRLFHSDNGLSIVGEDKDGRPELRLATREIVQDIMADAANWISTAFVPLKAGGFKEVVKQVTPPRELAENLLSQSKWPGACRLDGVVTAPVFARDGTLCAEPGYNRAARLWLALPHGFDIGDTEPTPAAVRDAKDLVLDTLLGDVAFADDKGASKAHAFALMILPFVRLMINGPTPLHLIDAPTQSSGKSYAAKICIAPFAVPSASAMKGDEEEWRKAIFAALLSGRSHVFFDNVKGSLNSPMFAAALTEPMLTERQMGGLKEVSVKVRCVWVATANNAKLDADTASRSVVMRLDTGMENPERRHFDFDPLAYIEANRSQVINAICTLIRNWQQQGSRAYKGKEQTRFGNWQAIIGGILEANGVEGFLGNLDQYRETLDPEKGAWATFCEAWNEKHGSAYMTTTDLLPLALSIPEVAATLGNHEKTYAVRLGLQLRARRDKVFDTFKIVEAPSGVSKRDGIKHCVQIVPKGA